MNFLFFPLAPSMVPSELYSLGIFGGILSSHKTGGLLGRAGWHSGLCVAWEEGIEEWPSEVTPTATLPSWTFEGFEVFHVRDGPQQ